MSTDSSFETYPRFGDCQDSRTIPPISSFAKRNTQMAGQCPQSGFYRELTVEEVDSEDPMSRSSQVTTSQDVMASQSHQQCNKAAAATYQISSQMINNMEAISNMASVTTASAVMTNNGIHAVPTTPGAETMSPPPGLPLHVANSSILGQALQGGNDMSDVPTLQQQLQQQQLLQVMHAARTQYDGHKLMSSLTCSDQSLNDQETSPNNNTTEHQYHCVKPALASFSSPAVPVSIQRVDSSNVLTMAQSPTTIMSAENTYSLAPLTNSSSSPTLPCGLMAANPVSNMSMSTSFLDVNNQPMVMSRMFVQNPGATSPEMVATDEQMLNQMSPGITNNNDADMMSNNMPVQCQQTSASKRRNQKKPVPNEEKDEKYFERRNRNNLAAKRSRDSRKKREDQVSMRANFLQKENDILRAQLATLRQEANSLRQLLSQQRPIAPAHVPMQMSMQMIPNSKTMGP